MDKYTMVTEAAIGTVEGEVEFEIPDHECEQLEARARAFGETISVYLAGLIRADLEARGSVNLEGIDLALVRRITAKGGAA